MWKKALPPMLLLFILLVPIQGLAASQASLNISNTGMIVYSSSPNFLFYDDFATTQLVGGKLTGWGAGSIHSPETVSFVSDPVNSGNRVLKVTKAGEGTDRETEIIVYRSETEFWASGSFYFPSDFALTTPDKWLGFIDFFFEYIDESHTLWMGAQVWGDNLELIIVRSRYDNGVIDDNVIHSNVFIKRGEWFTLKYHIVRDGTNGFFELWKDDVKIVEWSGNTRFMQDQFNWIPIKHYTDREETMKTIYYDNVVLNDEPI